MAIIQIFGQIILNLKMLEIETITAEHSEIQKRLKNLTVHWKKKKQVGQLAAPQGTDP